MSEIYVVPKPGLVILDPERHYSVMPPEGARVPQTQYWLTHVRDGAVTITTPPAPTA